jgi:hypothetical protein
MGVNFDPRFAFLHLYSPPGENTIKTLEEQRGKQKVFNPRCQANFTLGAQEPAQEPAQGL